MTHGAYFCSDPIYTDYMFTTYDSAHGVPSCASKKELLGSYLHANIEIIIE